MKNLIKDTKYDLRSVLQVFINVLYYSHIFQQTSFVL
jgi:hypothetical protein